MLRVPSVYSFSHSLSPSPFSISPHLHSPPPPPFLHSLSIHLSLSQRKNFYTVSPCSTAFITVPASCVFHAAMRYNFYDSTGLDIKDCPLARDNQIWLSGKQIFMPACPTDNQIFHILVHIYYIGQVKSLSGNQFYPFTCPTDKWFKNLMSSPALAIL
jgi:hypothetical protein